jgi:D-3-phosphoglycerate dehydrogenase
MKKVLANDGISPEGVAKLEAAGFTVVTDGVSQDQLIDTINNEGFDAVCVRSATTVRKEVIDACPGLKFIGRGGVGMDNIDVAYAREKGITVSNTPAASSQSVAELVMGDLFAISRFLHNSYAEMPVSGDDAFKKLKKNYAKGVELRGKTIGIVGFGRIGQALAKYAIGCGMNVIACDHHQEEITLEMELATIGKVTAKITPIADLNELLPQCDYISLHIPKQSGGASVINKKEFSLMKDGVRIVNAARGGVVNEDDLIEALDSGKVAAIGLDVFENEPNPRADLLKHSKIAVTPHIGAATVEAQARIGEELAQRIIETIK